MKISENPEPTVDNKLELVKHLGEVQSPIKQTITSDFIYAKLGDKDKEGITEMTANAQLGRNFYRYVEEKTVKWHWNKEKEQWEAKSMNKEHRETLKKYASTLADNYMIRPYMIANLARNQSDNFLIKITAGVPDNEPEEENDNTEIMAKAKELFGAKN